MIAQALTTHIDGIETAAAEAPVRISRAPLARGRRLAVEMIVFGDAERRLGISGA